MELDEMKDTIKQLGKRWFLCVVFGFDLLILVMLSEAIRNMILGLSPDSSSLGNWVTLFFWVFIMIPLILVPLWYLSPYAVKKLLITFGLSEETTIVEKPNIKESKKTMKKEHHLLLSKWFAYALITIVLFILLCFTLYEMSLGNNMATKFLPTLFGLMFTLVIFTIFFDLREKLEWKKVEDRVKRRIGMRIHGIFVELSNLCDVDLVLEGDDIFSDKAWRELQRKQLKQMTEKVKLNETAKKLWKERKLAFSYATLFDSRRARLSEIESTYIRFLNPTLAASIMDIQDYLENLHFELTFPHSKIEIFEERLSTIIEKIVKEIVTIRENGIDIGF